MLLLALQLKRRVRSPGAAVTIRKILMLKTSVFCGPGRASTCSCVCGGTEQAGNWSPTSNFRKKLGEAILLGGIYLVTAKGFPNLTQQSTRWSMTPENLTWVFKGEQQVFCRGPCPYGGDSFHGWVHGWDIHQSGHPSSGTPISWDTHLPDHTSFWDMHLMQPPSPGTSIHRDTRPSISLLPIPSLQQVEGAVDLCRRLSPALILFPGSHSFELKVREGENHATTHLWSRHEVGSCLSKQQ